HRIHRTRPIASCNATRGVTHEYHRMNDDGGIERTPSGEHMTASGQTHKTALVFGGSRGIGAAIALRLAQDGAHVALTYASAAGKAAEVAATIEQHGVDALALQADSAN